MVGAATNKGLIHLFPIADLITRDDSTQINSTTPVSEVFSLKANEASIN
jgi:hypothetical protein